MKHRFLVFLYHLGCIRFWRLSAELGNLRWFVGVCVGDVLYNAEFPLCAPDVIFGPEDEHFHPFRLRNREGGNNMEGAKNSLSDWNHKDPTRLCALIQELRQVFSRIWCVVVCRSECSKWLRVVNGTMTMLIRDEYMAYQRRRAGEVHDDRLTFEISTILSREVNHSRHSRFWHFHYIMRRCGLILIFFLCMIPFSLLQGIEMHMSSGLEKVFLGRMHLVFSFKLQVSSSIDIWIAFNYISGYCAFEF